MPSLWTPRVAHLCLIFSGLLVVGCSSPAPQRFEMSIPANTTKGFIVRASGSRSNLSVEIKSMGKGTLTVRGTTITTPTSHTNATIPSGASGNPFPIYRITGFGDDRHFELMADRQPAHVAVVVGGAGAVEFDETAGKP